MECILIIIFLILGWFLENELIIILCIFVYGPFLVWLSTKTEEKKTKIMLLFIGATMITYNGRKWMKENKTKDSSVSHPASW